MEFKAAKIVRGKGKANERILYLIFLSLVIINNVNGQKYGKKLGTSENSLVVVPTGMK